GDAGALVVATSAEYPELEYTVQFRESDMEFATRLMERHGISYHFRHEAGAHSMVLTDCVDVHDSIGRRDFHASETNHRFDEEHFWTWQPARRITTGAVRLVDYNFKTPMAAMEVDRMGDATHDQGQIESFDWPGDYPDQGRGRVVAQLRSDAERGQDRRFEAEGDVLSLGAGARVTLAGDPVPGSGAEYLCLVASHSYTSDNYGTGGTRGDDLAYRGRYVLMPGTAPMLPERKTPLADVRGPQTAMVVGAEGEEIDCDEYGRILVRFHWDLDKANSMRCRVSQNWAGNGWGGMVIPRVGMEVVVEFLDGDPDQPLVTGCVYNGRNKVPYELPEHKTRSTFKTDTHQGTGFNELRFEDEKGREEIFVHAEKDMNIEVQNDRSKRVERHQHEVIGADKSIEVGGDHDETISGNMSIAVGKNPLSQTLKAKTRLLFSKAGGIMEKLKLPDPFNFAKGNMQMFVEKNKSEIVNIASSEIVGVSKSTIVGHSFQQSVGKAMSVIVRGRHDTDIGKVMNVRVGDQLTIQVGENSMITMSKEGKIVVKGKKIVFDADQIDLN
ncbi:type VI secretion system Vgr family protein, partial [Roseinatronobacter alkalisoli]